jgi:hypothetical protein
MTLTAEAYVDPIWDGTQAMLGLDIAAVALLAGEQGSTVAAVQWLCGSHPGWCHSFGTLDSQLRDRMRRAGGDLAFDPRNRAGAIRALYEAASVLRGENE